MASNEQTTGVALAGAMRVALGILMSLLVITSGIGVVGAVPDAGTTAAVHGSTADAGVDTPVQENTGVDAGETDTIDTSASVEGVVVSTTGAIDPLPGKRLAAQGSSESLSGGYATITGQVFYQDGDGNSHPARQVEVSVQDKDLVEKFTYDTTWTDDQGRFELTFDATEPDWGSSASVIVEVYADNPAARATTGALRDTYETETEKFTISNGETKDLGQFASDGDQAPWQAVDWALDARREIADRADGWTREQVRIQYPQGDGARASNVPGFKRISLPDSGWDENTVHHEYGHTVMDTVYDGKIWNWPVPETDHWSGCHVPDSETDDAYAWIEGWAEFHEGVVADDPTADGMDLEDRDYYEAGDNGDCFDGDRGDMDGHRVEGSVASILWDLYDGDRHYSGSDDDGLTYSLDIIYSAVDGRNVGNANELWDALRTDANHEELRKIYFENGIVKPDRFEGETPTLSDGDSVDAQISNSDADSYEVDLEEGEQLTVDVSFDDSDADLSAAIEGSGGDVAGQSDSSTDGEQVAVTATQDGTHTITVSEHSSDSAQYTLDVSVSEADDGASGIGDDVWIPDGGWYDWGAFDGLDLSWFDTVEFGNASCEGELARHHGGVSADSGQYERTESFETLVDGDCDVEVRVEPHFQENADLDLYATLDGRTPTTSDYDQGAITAGSAESLVLDADDLDRNATVGVAVHAYAGTANFTVVVEEVDEDG